jgi:hypothetical protein
MPCACLLLCSCSRARSGARTLLPHYLHAGTASACLLTCFLLACAVSGGSLRPPACACRTYAHACCCCPLPALACRRLSLEAALLAASMLCTRMLLACGAAWRTCLPFALDGHMHACRTCWHASEWPWLPEPGTKRSAAVLVLSDVALYAKRELGVAAGRKPVGLCSSSMSCQASLTPARPLADARCLPRRRTRCRASPPPSSSSRGTSASRPATTTRRCSPALALRHCSGLLPASADTRSSGAARARATTSSWLALCGLGLCPARRAWRTRRAAARSAPARRRARGVSKGSRQRKGGQARHHPAEASSSAPGVCCVATYTSWLVVMTLSRRVGAHGWTDPACQSHRLTDLLAWTLGAVPAGDAQAAASRLSPHTLEPSGLKGMVAEGRTAVHPQPVWAADHAYGKPHVYQKLTLDVNK